MQQMPDWDRDQVAAAAAVAVVAAAVYLIARNSCKGQRCVDAAAADIHLRPQQPPLKVFAPL